MARGIREFLRLRETFWIKQPAPRLKIPATDADADFAGWNSHAAVTLGRRVSPNMTPTISAAAQLSTIRRNSTGSLAILAAMRRASPLGELLLTRAAYASLVNASPLPQRSPWIRLRGLQSPNRR